MELDLDNSLLLEEEELTDTGCNLAAEEGKLDPQAMAQALQYMEKKDTELWASYMEGGAWMPHNSLSLTSCAPCADGVDRWAILIPWNLTQHEQDCDRDAHVCRQDHKCAQARHFVPRPACQPCNCSTRFRNHVFGAPRLCPSHATGQSQCRSSVRWHALSPVCVCARTHMRSITRAKPNAHMPP